MPLESGAIYVVMIFETLALVGRIFGEYHGDIPSGTRRVADYTKAFPRWEGERLQSWTHGTRADLFDTPGVMEWISDDVLDRCDADRLNQQEVELPEDFEAPEPGDDHRLPNFYEEDGS